MESIISQLSAVVSRAGELAETKTEILKLKTAGKIAETVSSLIGVIAIVCCGLAASLVLSIGIAVWIGTALGQLSLGFFIMGGFYTVAGFFIYRFRKSWIKTPLSNLVIDKLIR